MNILEHEIEDLIYHTWSEDQGATLAEMGLDCVQGGAMLRQVDFGVIGTPDLVHIRMDGPVKNARHVDVTILELKRGKLNYDALGQVCRYVSNTQRLLDERYGKRTNAHVRGVLIGSEVNLSGDFVYAADSAININVMTYSLDARTGLSFQYHWGYFRKDSAPQCLERIAPTIASVFKHYLWEMRHV